RTCTSTTPAGRSPSTKRSAPSPRTRRTSRGPGTGRHHLPGSRMTDGPRRLWRTVARPAWPGVDRARLAALTRRTREVLLIAGMTGAVVGLVVAGVEGLVGRVRSGQVSTLPLPAQLVLPAVGVGLSVLCLRIRGRHSASTTDEYIRSFHDQTGRLDLRAVPARLAASVVTLGSGAPLG